jgi:hypothetical protein
MAWTLRQLGPGKHFSIDDEKGDQVASTCVRPDTEQIARLIASAPDLFEELSLAFRHLRHLMPKALDHPDLLRWERLLTHVLEGGDR